MRLSLLIVSLCKLLPVPQISKDTVLLFLRYQFQTFGIIYKGIQCLTYYFNYATVFTDDYGQVELLVQVVHYLVNVPVHKEDVEVIEVNVPTRLLYKVTMEPADRHVVLCS